MTSKYIKKKQSFFMIIIFYSFCPNDYHIIPKFFWTNSNMVHLVHLQVVMNIMMRMRYEFLKRPCDFISVTSKNDITSLYPRKYEGIKRLIKALLDFHGKKTRTFLEKKNTSILEELLFVYLPLITIHYACYVEFFPNVSNCLKRFLSSLIKCIGSVRTLALLL